MNQKWPVLLLALLLCGCRNQQIPAEAALSVPAIAVTEPTESVGFYAPESMAESATAGAVRAFPLDTEDATGIRFLGEDILLFSGHDPTTLTLLSGETRYIEAQLQLPCTVDPEDPAVVVDQRGVAYVDGNRRILTVLNEQLEEICQIRLPEGCGAPALSADRKLLYYCTADGLRVFELETGLDRLLREMSFPLQELTALHCDDTVIQCSITCDDGSRRSLFFDASTGSLIREATEHIPLWTCGDFYVAFQLDGIYPEWLTGTGDSEPKLLVPETEPACILPVPQMHGALTYCPRDDGTALLECYRLESGSKTAQVTVPGISEPNSPKWHSDNILWFLSTDSSTGRDVLYAWSLDASATEETETFLQPRWSQENPDLDGLAQCSLLARQLSNKHGVNVMIWADATAFQPWDYTLVPEHQVPLLRSRLEELDLILSKYPEGFLKKAGAGIGSSRLSICLVRSINGNADTGALSSAMGLQYWDAEASAYVAVTVGPEMAQHLFHELFHILDTRVLSTCKAYDDWNKLNPKGFSYDIRYASSRSGEGRTFLAAENRYFIDLYSMSYAKEDRARIMEYAMLDGQSELFRSTPMQAKLRRLCLGIRQTFGLEKETDIYCWEQYLDVPLSPSP